MPVPRTTLRQRRTLWGNFIYAIVGGFSAGDFFVKIGRSKDPIQRYWSLSTGIPFESTMLYAPTRTRGRAVELETALHHALADYRVHGEWFRFDRETKAKFHAEAARLYLESEEEPLRWNKISVKDAGAMVMLAYRSGQSKAFCQRV